MALKRRLTGRPSKNFVLTGLRGVGKTVLLSEFGRVAETLGYVHEHIEADEATNFPVTVAHSMRRVLLRLSASERRSELVQRALGVLKAFTLRLPSGPEFSIDVASVPGPADSGDLGPDLSGLFSEVGRAAQDSHTGVFITIDELQYLSPQDLSALIVGLHRTAQLSLPIIVGGAGLPSLPGMLGDAKSYAERLFEFREIASLSSLDAATAIADPAAAEGVTWTEEALASVVELTQGYPYFLQEFGKETWDAAPGPTTIQQEDVRKSVDITLATLDAGFFRVRIDRTSTAERAYLRAMADLGPGPSSSADVATRLGKTTGQLGPVRDRLIKRGLCYSPRWGEIAYTVPMFDGFMKRWMPAPP